MPIDPVATAMAILDLARADQFTEIHERLAPTVRSLMSPDSLRSAWSAAIARLGPVVAVGPAVMKTAGGHAALVSVPLTFERGEQTLVVSVSASGEVAGIQLTPGSPAPTIPWEPPSYATEEAFDEEDVIVGSGPSAVPGTLSLPRQTSPWPGLVLLGSGPLDRDETIGRNKPFKDLAWGLASRGVAVLRFDKVAYAHPKEASRPDGYTILDQYLPSAVAAIHLLRQRPGVDRERVFLLGHSLAATVAPRVAAAERGIAGLVLLAGGAQPLHWILVRQVRYLASLDPETAAASEPIIEKVTAEAQLVDSADLSTATPASDLPLGLPASYWLDLRAYDPPKVAAALGRPILVLQGGRDYQATVADDLARWEAGLEGRRGVTIRLYPADNHLFFSGSGPSSPAEYEPAQHVDPDVVNDIAGWLKTAGQLAAVAIPSSPGGAEAP